MCLFSKVLMAQSEFSVTHIDSRSNLPQNDIHHITFDNDGFLWGMSEMGLFRLDGRNISEFKSSTHDILLDNNYIDFLHLKNNQLYVADVYGGVVKIDSGTVTNAHGADLNVHTFVNIDGLFPNLNYYQNQLKFNKNVGLKIAELRMPFVYAFSQSEWVSENNKMLYFYNSNRLTDSLQLPFISIKWFYINNHLYFINEGFEVFEINNLKTTFHPVKTSLDILFKGLEQKAYTLFDQKDNGCCARINQSVYYIYHEAGNLHYRIIVDTLPEKIDITDIAYNEAQRLAVISTNSSGLFFYRQNKFKTISFKGTNKNETNAFYSQVTLDSNTIYTDWNLEATIDGAKKSALNLQRNFEENILRLGNQLYYCNGDSFIKFDLQNKQKKLLSYDFQSRPFTFAASADSIFVGYRNKICVLKNDSLHTLIDFSKNKYRYNCFQIFMIDKVHMFYCAFRGAYIYNIQTKKTDTIKPLHHQLVHNALFHQGFVIIGTYSSGYYLYKDKRLVKMPMDENNHLATANSFLVDKKNQLWIGTNRGLFRTDFNALVNYFTTKRQVINYAYYNENEGMISDEFNGGCTTSAIKLDNGFASMVSMHGLIWFKPENVIDDLLTYKVFIDKIWLDGKNTGNKLYLIPKQTENIKIELATAYWGHIENLQIEYRIEGFNKLWTHIDPEKKFIEFNKPPAGNYNLEIRKRTGFGTGDYQVLLIPFNVEQKFNETALFYFLIVFGLLICIALILKTITLNVNRKNKKLESKVQQRTSQLQSANNQLKHSIEVKDKLISIVSHDIITPLKFLSMVAKQTTSHHISQNEMHQAMVDIKNTSENLYNNAQNILNWIKHQNNRFDVSFTHVALSSLCDEEAIIFNEFALTKNTSIINTVQAEAIIKTDKTILGIVLKNIISNAVKHTSDGTITISCSIHQQKCIISITDTGIGINLQQLQRINTIIYKTGNSNTDIENNQGLGYLIISDLVELLKGSIAVESVYGKGTSVHITLPI
jgi:signal transduction histidine kinase